MGMKLGIQVASVEHARGQVDGELGNGIGGPDEDVGGTGGGGESSGEGEAVRGSRRSGEGLMF